ncbi:MAG: hypothetical protein WC890_06970 [Candidatus Margulisiibacteriota bacterium]
MKENRCHPLSNKMNKFILTLTTILFLSSCIYADVQLKHHKHPKSPMTFGLEGSYGDWYTVQGGSSTKSSEPVKEIGLYLKTNMSENGFVKYSGHYIFPLSGAASSIGSYAAIDLCGNNDLFEVGLGATYLLPGTSGLTGGLGYQAAAGIIIGNATVGAKYLILNATTSGISYYYSQILLNASIDFSR